QDRRPLFRACHARAVRGRAPGDRRAARPDRRLARRHAQLRAARRRDRGARRAAVLGQAGVVLDRARVLARRTVGVARRRPQHGAPRAAGDQRGRGGSRLDRHPRHARQAAHHPHLGADDLRGRRALRSVPALRQTRYGVGHRHQPEDGVRRDRRRHVRDARADGRSGVHAAALLSRWGYRFEYHEYAEARTSVIARAGGSPSKAPLCLTGHLDVVPLGSNAWTRDPFAGETQGDRLYGRGSSDMKAGVAAMLLAAKNLARKISGTPGIVLVLTAAEEGGCIGSYHLAQTQLLGSAGAMIVGEPTANYPYVGHKGSLKFYAGFRGTSAHGSMPELGVNAIYKAARAVSKLEAFDFAQPEHP